MSLNDYSNLDITQALTDANEHELWRAHLLGNEHMRWADCLRTAEAKGDANAATQVRGWIDALPPMSAIEQLAVSTRLADLLGSRRWYVMRDAREQGAPWSAIAKAADMAEWEARDWYQHTIEQQERYVGDLHDTERARAALRSDTVAGERG